MVNRICDKLSKAGLVNLVLLSEDNIAVAPAVDTQDLTVGKTLKEIDMVGNSHFIPRFDLIYAETLTKIDDMLNKAYSQIEDIPLSQIPLPTKENLS